MIPYELAKKLKDAGFPQNGERLVILAIGKTSKVAQKYPYVLKDDNELAYTPTLSELIEACGDNFLFIQNSFPKTNEPWTASSYILIGQDEADMYTYGKNPEEAVANLWLELHKK